MSMAEVNCRICKRPFIASSIESAMQAMKAHKEERHGVRERKASEYLPLTAWDRELLWKMAISAD